MSDKSENKVYRKLSNEEINYIYLKIGHGGRKSIWAEILDKLEIGEMIQVYEKVNRGTISRVGQRKGKKFSVHVIDGNYYIERIA